jgi:mono/diheme cytochrome c family protein
VELLHAPVRLSSNVEDKLLRTIWFVAAAIDLVASGGIAFAEDAVDPTAVKSEDGKYLDKEGNPTFKVAPTAPSTGTPIPGYRRYHSECHVCHGPTARDRPTRRR